MQTDYYQPCSLPEALEFRSDCNTVVLAGGTDLVLELRRGKYPDRSIIDISKLDALHGVDVLGQKLRIGACTTFSELLEAKTLPIPSALYLAAASVGSCQIRNQGTIGGNICNANPCADMVPVLTCLDAQVEMQHLGKDGVTGVRRLPLTKYIIGYGRTALREDEILTSVLLDLPDPQDTIVFDKIGRRKALATARVNGACRIRMEQDRIGSAALALGAVEERPRRMTEVEEYLEGKILSAGLCLDAGALAAESVLAHSGRRDSSDYKHPVIQRFVASLLEKASQK